MSEKAVGKDDTLRIDFVRCIWCRLFKSKKKPAKAWGRGRHKTTVHINKPSLTSNREVMNMSSSESVLSQAKGMIESSISCALEQFQNERFGTVRIVMRENEPWFVAKDVAACIEYDPSSINKMCSLCRDKDKVVASASDFNSDVLSESGNSRITLISESGLYRILAS